VLTITISTPSGSTSLTLEGGRGRKKGRKAGRQEERTEGDERKQRSKGNSKQGSKETTKQGNKTKQGENEATKRRSDEATQRRSNGERKNLLHVQVSEEISPIVLLGTLTQKGGEREREKERALV
jgi:hypothetical protein